MIAIVIAIRLSAGPIDVTFFKPQLEKSLGDAIGLNVALRQLNLSLKEKRLALLAMGAELADPSGTNLASADTVEIRLNLQALAQGKLKPSRLDVEKASLMLIKRENKTISMQVLRSAEERTSKQNSYDIFDVAKKWNSGSIRISEPMEIFFQDASVAAVDESTELKFFEAKATAGVTLTPERLIFWADVFTEKKISTKPLRVSVTLNMGDDGSAYVQMQNNNLEAFANFSRIFNEDLGNLKGRANAELLLKFNKELQPLSGNASITVTDAGLTLATGRYVEIEQGRANATADFQTGTITFQKLSLSNKRDGIVVNPLIIKQQQQNGQLTYLIDSNIQHADFKYLIDLFGLNNKEINGLEGVLSANLKLEFNNEALITAEADIKASGQIKNNNHFSESIAFSEARANVRLVERTHSIHVSDASADIDGAIIQGEGQITLNADGKISEFVGTLETGSFPIEQLTKLWPQHLSPAGRSWVRDNLSVGSVKEAKLSFRKALNEHVKVAGSFAAEGLTVQYWRPMPLATKVTGSGKLSGDSLEIDITQAFSGGMSSDNISLRLTELATPSSAISINAAIVGPVSNLLNALEAEPLHYPIRIGVNSANTRGTVDGRLNISFPLTQNLTPNDLNISAAGRVINGLFPGAINSWDIATNVMNVTVGKNHLQLDGEGQLLDAPINFKGQLTFGATKEQGRFKGVWALNEKARNYLFPSVNALEERVKGIVPAQFNITVGQNNTTEILVDSDLKNAEVSIHELGWFKPRGISGNLSAILNIQNNKLQKIDQIKLASPDVEFEAVLEFDETGKSLIDAKIHKLFGLGHDLKADLRVSKDGQEHVQISGSSLDIRPLLKQNKQAEVNDVQDNRIEPQLRTRNIKVDISKARVSEKFFIRNLAANIQTGNRLPISADIHADYEGGELKVTAYPDGKGNLTATASNFGHLLNAVGITSGAESGTAVLTVSEEPDGFYGTNFEAKDFDISKEEIRKFGGEKDTGLLSGLRELGGIAGSLILSAIDGGDAIRFDQLELNGDFKSGRLNIHNARAEGTALGLTAKGFIDLNDDTIEIEGAVSPAYGITRAIDSFPVFDLLPVLRQMVIGTNQEGIFATNYRAFGRLEEPEFTFNSLSTFAPGILREVLPAPSKSPEALK